MNPAYKKHWLVELKRQMAASFPNFRKLAARQFDRTGGLMSGAIQVFEWKPCDSLSIYIAIDPVPARDQFDLFFGWSTHGRLPCDRWDSISRADDFLDQPEFLVTHQDLQDVSRRKSRGSWLLWPESETFDEESRRFTFREQLEISDDTAHDRVRLALQSALSELAEMLRPMLQRLVDRRCHASLTQTND